MALRLEGAASPLDKLVLSQRRPSLEWPRTLQNRHRAPPLRSADSESPASSDHESAALRLSCSTSSQARHRKHPLQCSHELLDTKPRPTDEPAQGAGSKILAVMHRHGERGTSRTLHADVRAILANSCVPKSFESSDGLPARAIGKPWQETRRLALFREPLQSGARPKGEALHLPQP